MVETGNGSPAKAAEPAELVEPEGRSRQPVVAAMIGRSIASRDRSYARQLSERSHSEPQKGGCPWPRSRVGMASLERSGAKIGMVSPELRKYEPPGPVDHKILLLPSFRTMQARSRQPSDLQGIRRMAFTA